MAGKPEDAQQVAADGSRLTPVTESSGDLAAPTTQESSVDTAARPRLVSLSLLSFLLDPATMMRWCQLSLFSFLVLILLVNALYFGASDGPQRMFAVLLYLLLAPAVVMLVYMASVSFLVIVEDTANGHALIKNWPGVNFFDWIPQSFFVINAGVFSILPGALMGQVVGLGSESLLGICLMLGSLTGFFLFPLMLLSMIVLDSPLAAASPIIFRSLRKVPAVWKSFYLMSAGLAALSLVALLLVSTRGLLSLAFASAAFVSVAMIYFRLLGRMAAVIAEHVEEEPEEMSSERDARQGGD